MPGYKISRQRKRKGTKFKVSILAVDFYVQFISFLLVLGNFEQINCNPPKIVEKNQ